jgi:serine/threonine protein kinase
MFGNPEGRDDTQRSFENEVRVISKLCKSNSHANIVSVFRLGDVKDSALFYIDMELCDGNLEQFMRDRRGTIELNDVWNIMVQVTSGLAYIHSQGEVHRDMKPRNSKSQLEGSC